jgi:hypothetical protein
MRFTAITGPPDPWLHNTIATGAPWWRGKAPEAFFSFLALNKELFSDLNFRTLF